MRRILCTIAAAAALLLGAPLAAQAETVEESFTDAGPVDLSGSDHETGNVGERVQLGSVELGEGEWTITASVRLFVPDVEQAWKNSQGCGLYSDGTQLAGAGGSSNIWTATEDGKEVVLGSDEFPFRLAPDWLEEPLVLEGPATVVLECFIDQSHSGAAPEEREGMAATDISLVAATEVEPEPCEFDDTLTAGGEACVAPDDDTDTDDSDSDGNTDDSDNDTSSNTDDSDNDTAAVPTAIPAGAETLPNTGVSPLLLGAGGLVLLLVGGALVMATRQRRAARYRA